LSFIAKELNCWVFPGVLLANTSDLRSVSCRIPVVGVGLWERTASGWMSDKDEMLLLRYNT